MLSSHQIVIKLVKRIDLIRTQASVSIGRRGTKQGICIQKTGLRRTDDSIDEAVLSITLFEDFGFDDGEKGRGYVVAAVDGEVLEAEVETPGLEVDVPPGGGTR